MRARHPQLHTSTRLGARLHWPPGAPPLTCRSRRPNLYNNGLGAEGGAAIGAALPKLTQLQTLE